MDDDLLRRLVDSVASWAGRSGQSVLLVFDGDGASAGGGGRVTPLVEVLPSGARSGDSVLEAEAARLAAAAHVYWLVSDDRALRQTAGGAAARTLHGAEFVAELVGGGAEAEELREPSGGARSRGGIAGGLSEEQLDRLERMRRSLD